MCWSPLTLRGPCVGGIGPSYFLVLCCLPYCVAAPPTDLFWNAVLGQYQGNSLCQAAVRYGLAAADVNADGVPELFVSTETGGVSSYAVRNSSTPTLTRPAAGGLGLALHPNPARAQASAETARPTRVSLLDLAGRVVRLADALARQHLLKINNLTPGLYLVRAEAADGSIAVQRLAVAQWVPPARFVAGPRCRRNHFAVDR